MSRRLLVISLVVIAVVAGIAAYALWPRGSGLEQATQRLPGSTLRVTWTDWAGVRAELGAGDAPDDVEAFLTEASDQDLSSASATAAVGPLVQRTFGFSPTGADWELLGQGPEGMVLVFGLPDDTDFGEIADRYAEHGFTEPEDDRLDGGVWVGGPDVLVRTGLDEPVLQHVALLEDERLLVASDDPDYLREAVPVVRGDEDGLDLTGLADGVEDPLASIAFVEDHACRELSMSAADEGAQATAEELVDEAGGVDPLTGYLVALRPDRRMTVVLDFETDDQAEQNARSRARLATMEDPGQFVSYADLFHVADAEQDGSRVLLHLDDLAADGYPLTNLTQGPVLLAAC